MPQVLVILNCFSVILPSMMWNPLITPFRQRSSCPDKTIQPYIFQIDEAPIANHLNDKTILGLIFLSTFFEIEFRLFNEDSCFRWHGFG